MSLSSLFLFPKKNGQQRFPLFCSKSTTTVIANLSEAFVFARDVDEAYYLDQISVIFERVAKQRKNPAKYFLTSLIEGNILQSEQGFDLPVVDPAFLTEQNGSSMEGLSEFDRRTFLADYLGKHLIRKQFSSRK